MSWSKLCVHKSAGGMGFRKLHEFNLAMLGKQGWRLLTSPDSLVSRIFQARYFLSSSFMEAELGSNPSYIWRSILAAQNMIRSGARWRIGNGSNVRIWGDPWFPDELNPYVESPLYSNLENAFVGSLMSTSRNAWEEDILEDLFIERDRNLIKQIPLGSVSRPDKWYWLWDKKGVYSVKSGYRFLTSDLAAAFSS